MSYQLRLRYSSRLGVHQHRLWTQHDLHRLSVPDHEPQFVVRLPRDRTAEHIAVDLRLGRFYPSRLLNVDDAPAPVFRVIDADASYIVLDFNHPLSGVPEQITFDSVASDLAGIADRERLMLWAGMDTALPERDTDHGNNDAFVREDESDDTVFYRTPRNVMHVDTVCAGRIAALYSELIQDNGRVLDLMASWRSHLPGDLDEAVGLGMNSDEMSENPQLTEYVIHDLNRQPALPFADTRFDAIVNTVSFEYLVYPEQVLASALEKLKEGGLLAISFSNRFFPSKAIRLWRQLHPVERVSWVAQRMRAAGFGQIRTLVEHGVQRPADDPYTPHFKEMDPLMAVWGYRS